MKVRLLVSRAGLDFANVVGDVIDVPADEGKRLIATEQAVAVDAEQADSATAKSARKAVKKAK